MQVLLYCSCCHGRFDAPPDTPVAEVLDRVSAEGPWSALGDGETLEDHVSALLNDQEPIRCPECGAAVTVDEQSLGRFTREMLAQW